MNDFQAIAEMFSSALRRIDVLERKQETLLMVGQAKDITGDKQVLVFDEAESTSGKPFTSPPVRRANAAGANGQGFRERSRPQEGETMLLINPGGVIGPQSRAIPYGPTDESAEPDKEPDAPKVWQMGDAMFSFSESGLKIVVGGVTHTITAAGLTTTGGRVEHDGLNIGSGHTHGGITPGRSNTDIPNE